MITTDRTEQAERERKLVQTIAVALWEAATSDNREISTYNTIIYRSLERALIESIKTVYHVGPTRARKVRDLLAEYGPDDSLQGTNGRGIVSYVEYVKNHPGREF